MILLSLHSIEKDEIYLTFKTMNESKTGSLAMQEFYNIYHIAGLSWTVRSTNVISYVDICVGSQSFLLHVKNSYLFNLFLCKRGACM